MFAVIRMSSWNQAKKFLEGRALWAFRGQSDANWPLETTLYREAVRKDVILETLPNREDWMLYQFKRFAHYHRNDLPPEDDVLDWLALLQHYGAPTRLLDFTSSGYIAAFFAMESARGDAAVWGIDEDEIDQAAGAKFGLKSGGAINEIRSRFNKKFCELFTNGTKQSAVVVAEPIRMHERLYTQRGRFLAPTDPSKPFLHNLATTFDVSPKIFNTEQAQPWSSNVEKRMYADGKGSPLHVIKAIIPREWHHDALSDLQDMNISAATLFPGLDGFARSLRYHL